MQKDDHLSPTPPDSSDAMNNLVREDDRTAAERKKDHIELAFQSQVAHRQLDTRFYYEPMLAAHPVAGSFPVTSFLGKTLRLPVWVSSMTGGTAFASTINHNLARACKAFGMGMGLGSCRSLLFSDDTLPDFNVRPLMGDEVPLYANLGIAQVEQLLKTNQLSRVSALLEKLQADGLIIHVNPFQEWLQPEGDHLENAPLDTIRRFIDGLPNVSLIIKEVGQGMGRQSLEALMRLPLAAIDFAANGGTNFAKLELLRSDAPKQSVYEALAYVGHSAAEMTNLANELLAELGDAALCRQFIISGGVRDFLDGYYLVRSLRAPSVYGQASAFLRHARGEYQLLHQYVESQAKGLELANAFLRIKQ